MPVNLAHCRVNSPFRPVNWRFERASALRNAGRPTSRRKDDAYIAKIISYLNARAIADPANSWDLEDFIEGHHDMYCAHELYVGSEHVQLRWFMEAWLLAHIPIARVAEWTKQSVQVIELYEACFFNVFDRITHGDWMMAYVIGKSVFEGLTPRDYPTVWKLVAYLGGEWALEPFVRMGSVAATTRPDGPVKTTPFYSSQAFHTHQRGRMVNAWGIRFSDPFLRVQFEDTCIRMDDSKNKTGELGGGQSDYRTHVEAMISALPMGVGLLGIASQHSRKLGIAGPEDTGSREMRASESMLVRAGQSLPQFDNMPPPVFPERNAKGSSSTLLQPVVKVPIYSNPGGSE